MTTRIRRDRAVDNTEEVKALVVAYSEQNAAMKAAALRMSELSKEIEAKMAESKMKSISANDTTAAFVPDIGRKSSLIDTKALQKLVKPEEFHQCITAVKGKCEDFLSKKELASITTEVPGKDNGEKFSISVK